MARAPARAPGAVPGALRVRAYYASLTHEEILALATEEEQDASSLQRRIHKVERDRYKWAEHAMDGTVPPDIAREKQNQLARQLTALQGELDTLERAGVDAEATATPLNAVLDRLSDPGRTYRGLAPGDKRRCNQAW